MKSSTVTLVIVVIVLAVTVAMTEFRPKPSPVPIPPTPSPAPVVDYSVELDAIESMQEVTNEGIDSINLNISEISGILNRQPEKKCECKSRKHCRRSCKK